MQPSIEHYLALVKSDLEKLIAELEMFSVEETESMIQDTDWWLALANDCEKEPEYQQLCNLLFQSRKHKLDSQFAIVLKI